LTSDDTNNGEGKTWLKFIAKSGEVFDAAAAVVAVLLVVADESI
jgi:hypothetical protein